MPDRKKWRALIKSMNATRPTPVVMSTFIERFDSASKPVKLLGQDDRIYLVKGRQNGRMVVNEQVVATLGGLIGAPVGKAGFADISATLISAEPLMSHVEPGISHATAWIEDATDRQGIAYTDVPDNVERFAALAVLYTWVWAHDRQWIYNTTTPHLVYSVDHGHFFPGGPNWSSASLNGVGPPVLDDAFQQCGLQPADYVSVKHRLEALSEAQIAEAVARPWEDWAITEDERIDMAVYLYDRLPSIIELIPQE